MTAVVRAAMAKRPMTTRCWLVWAIGSLAVPSMSSQLAGLEIVTRLMEQLPVQLEVGHPTRNPACVSGMSANDEISTYSR